MESDKTEQWCRSVLARLPGFCRHSPFVLALAPGGASLARALAEELDAELGFIQAEALAVGDYRGAVSETGEVVLDSGGVGSESFEERFAASIVEGLSRMVERRVRLVPESELPEVGGRVVLLVADGLASGARMRAALKSLRQRGAERVVAVAAAGTEAAIGRIESLADEVVCLVTHRRLGGLGRAFGRWTHVSEEIAFQLLNPVRWTAGTEGFAPA